MTDALDECNIKGIVTVMQHMKSKGTGRVVAHIEMLIGELADLTARKGLNEAQAKYFSNMFITDYAHETLEDLVIVLKKIVEGDLPEQYRGNIIDIEMLNKMLKERLIFKANFRQFMHESKKGDDGYDRGCGDIDLKGNVKQVTG